MSPLPALNMEEYPPVANYGFIGDCHGVALVSRMGSVDWCCLPRIDSPSCFGRLLDWNRGGYCLLMPEGDAETSRRYVGGSLVLETTFRTSEGEARLLDCFTMREGGSRRPDHQLLRVIDGRKGKMNFEAMIQPRFNYGAVIPWVREVSDKVFIIIGGSDGMVVSGDLQLDIEDHRSLRTSFTVEQGERFRLSLAWRRPERIADGSPPNLGAPDLDEALNSTIEWWKEWSGRCEYNGPHREHVLRSAVVLKGLTNAPTGAIAAAATTSLPAAPDGGARNWDYRLSWIRDSSFTVRSLARLGYEKEADGFRRFIERTAAGSAEQIRVVYGVGGENRLLEYEAQGLEGYRGAKPVRVGNAATRQLQLDVLGELLDHSWRWQMRGNSPDAMFWHFLVDTVNFAAARWTDPDRGIWEVRAEPRHYVHSKTMCWVALDRGIRLAETLDREAPLEGWRSTREEIRRTIESDGYDSRRGVFIQAFGMPTMDAALLLLPEVGFVPYDDERVVRTVQAIRDDLEDDGLLYRYPPQTDGLGGPERPFLPCSFWLAECLYRQQRQQEADQVMRRAVACANDLLLFSEQFDQIEGSMLGNFPQGLTHLSLIAAAIAASESSSSHDG